jgi:hypothetical protein
MGVGKVDSIFCSLPIIIIDVSVKNLSIFNQLETWKCLSYLNLNFCHILL